MQLYAKNTHKTLLPIWFPGSTSGISCHAYVKQPLRKLSSNANLNTQTRSDYAGPQEEQHSSALPEKTLSGPIPVWYAGAIRLPAVLSERGRPAVCVSYRLHRMHSCPVNHTMAAWCDKLKNKLMLGRNPMFWRGELHKNMLNMICQLNKITI